MARGGITTAELKMQESTLEQCCSTAQEFAAFLASASARLSSHSSTTKHIYQVCAGAVLNAPLYTLGWLLMGWLLTA